MHSTALLFGFGTGIASIALGLFSRTILWCWITPVPKKWRVYFFYGPLWTSMLVVLGVNVWIYVTVRKREKRAGKLHSIHHKKHGKPHFGEHFETSNRSSIDEPKKRTSVRRREVKRSHEHRRLSTNKSRVSFTFGHHPFHIFSPLEITRSQDNGSKQDESSSRKQEESSSPCLDLLSIPEDSKSVRFSASEPLQVLESKTTEQRISLSEQFEVKQNKFLTTSGSGHTSKQSDTNQRNSSSRSFLPRTSVVSRIRSIFIPQLTDEPSFMFTQDDEEQTSRNEDDNTFFTSLTSIQKMVLPERTAKRFSRKIQKRQESASIRSAQVKFVLATVEDYPSAAKQYAATYHIGARIILYQSIAYVVGFWTIWAFPTARQIATLNDPQQLYWLICCQAFFAPFQGFFNFSVYRFAHFLRLKELHPRWTTVKLLRHTIRWTFLTNISNFAKAKKESVVMSNSSKDANIIQNVLINEAGQLRQGDDDYSDSDSECSSSSGLLEPEIPNIPSTNSSYSRVLNRMSSLMGDLMTEFTDYPETLNQDYKEVVGEDLFSYPTSYFPKVFAKQSFSAMPSSFPTVVPMTHFPIGQPSIHGASNEDREDLTQMPNDPIDFSKENSCNMPPIDQSMEENDTKMPKNVNEVDEV